MFGDITLTKPVFEGLIEHLVNIEENKGEIIDFYYPDSFEDREHLNDFLNCYIEKIDSIVEEIKVIDHPLNKGSGGINTGMVNEFPFVIIGSRVTVENMGSKKDTDYTIIHPSEHTKSKNDISYLSALGQTLILKNIGDVFPVHTPAGSIKYKVKSIKLI